LKKITAELLKAQIGLAMSGVPMSADAVRLIAAQSQAISSEEQGPTGALGDQEAAFGQILGWADRSQAEAEILAGQRPIGTQQSIAALFGRGDPASAPAEAFIRQNIEWNRRGVELASRAAALTQAAQANKPVAAEIKKLTAEMQAWIGAPPKPAEELQAIGTAAAASAAASNTPPAGGTPPRPTSFAGIGNIFGN
jgi:hypothetical protein